MQSSTFCCSSGSHRSPGSRPQRQAHGSEKVAAVWHPWMACSHHGGGRKELSENSSVCGSHNGGDCFEGLLDCSKSKGQFEQLASRSGAISLDSAGSTRKLAALRKIISEMHFSHAVFSFPSRFIPPEYWKICFVKPVTAFWPAPSRVFPLHTTRESVEALDPRNGASRYQR